MKILEVQSAVLTNYEVLTHLREMRARYEEQGRAAQPAQSDKKAPRAVMKSGNLETIMKEMTDYLEAAPSPLKDYNENTIHDLIKALEPFDLEEAELLMILNVRPASIPELDVVVEEAESRFSNNQMEEMIDIIADILGKAPEEQENGEEGGEQAAASSAS